MADNNFILFKREEEVNMTQKFFPFKVFFRVVQVL